jgi:hypothetical protein
MRAALWKLRAKHDSSEIRAITWLDARHVTTWHANDALRIAQFFRALVKQRKADTTEHGARHYGA